MKPYAEDAGDNHFPEAGLIRYARYLHQPFEDVPERICSHAPEKPHYRADEQRVAISVDWIAEPKQVYNQNLNINNYVGKDKYGYVEPFSKYQPDKSTRPKMIWREWNLNVPFKK